MTNRLVLFFAVAVAAASPAPSAGDVRFQDVAASAGLDFRHVNGMMGERWLVEIMGAGAAIFDFDGDGLMDIWLVQGGRLEDRRGDLPCDRLYRNATERGRLRFVDVTDAAGICADGYGMGVATGDIDNDGDLDVFVANYGPNQLFENLGDGRFRDVSRQAGIAADDWSVSASFADIDGDGLTDLYVANYVEFALADHKPCTDDFGQPSYCSPVVYKSAADRLYRNLGAGVFAESSARFGIDQARGAGLGVVAADFDGDRDMDFYVANDMTDNLLWINQGGGTFKDNALLAGAAANGDGMVEASMGIAAEDFDGDGDLDLFVTHLAVQTNTLYVNDGGGWFSDRTNVAGVAVGSIPYTGFGTAWFDAENDGDLDLFSANGAVTAIVGQPLGSLGLALRQPNQLWLNDGRGRYRENKSVADFVVPEVSRGAALGDLDNDGDLDILVANNGSQVRLYRNDSEGGHWLGVAFANVSQAAGVAWLEGVPGTMRRLGTDGSYASARDPRLLFGLASSDEPRVVRVRWPDGSEERFGPLAVDRYHVVERAKRSTGNSPAGER